MSSSVETKSVSPLQNSFTDVDVSLWVLLDIRSLISLAKFSKTSFYFYKPSETSVWE